MQLKLTIIVAPKYGVFVVETKNMKGWIVDGSQQETWAQTYCWYRFEWLLGIYTDINVVGNLVTCPAMRNRGSTSFIKLAIASKTVL